MSDYGDDYSDSGEFFYVEDEYMIADDLAEHAVNSPPPTTYGDEDALSDWDRFDYFNDLEYASDGYDDGKFSAQGNKHVNTREKRKRAGSGECGKKRQKVTMGQTGQRTAPAVINLPPVVWRAQTNRELKTNIWDGNTETYTLLKDWRTYRVPAWAARSAQSQNEDIPPSNIGGEDTAFVAEPPLMAADYDGDEDEEEGGEEEMEEEEEIGDEGEEGGVGIDPTILMGLLQSRLIEAGGPLAGMDPEQMLQFAMRMMTNKDAGDDIAGEMADELLKQGEDGSEEDDDEEAPAGLLSWLDKQREPTENGTAGLGQVPTPNSPDISLSGKRPPTPPSSEANRSVRATKDTMDKAKTRNNAALKQSSLSLEAEEVIINRKRKADDNMPTTGSSTNAAKRQDTKSYDTPTDTPTTASQVRAAPTPRRTRTSHAKRS